MSTADLCGRRRRSSQPRAAADRRAGVDRCCRGAAFLRQRLPHLPVHPGAGLCDRADGPEHSHRLQRPDLARTRGVLRGRRLYGSDPDGPVRRALLGDDPGRRGRVPGVRVPVRPAGAAPARTLPRARHVRARRGDAADPQVQADRRLDRWRAGHRDPQAGSAGGPADQPGQVALLRSRSRSRSCCSCWRGT